MAQKIILLLAFGSFDKINTLIFQELQIIYQFFHLKHQLFHAQDYFKINSSIIPTTNSILYRNNNQKYTGNFETSNINKFLNSVLAPEMFRNVQTRMINDENKQNPYGFNFDGVSEEDIIKGAVESNIAVFLHGRSSEGKSARVK